MTLAELDFETFWATSSQTSLFEWGMCVCFIASSSYSIARLLSGNDIDQETVWARSLFLLGCALGVAYKVFDSFNVAIIGYLLMLLVAFIDLTLYSCAKRKADDRRLVDELSSSQTHKSSRRHSHRHGESESGEHSHKHRSRWGSRRSHSHHGDGERSSDESPKSPRFDDPLSDAAPSDDK